MCVCVFVSVPLFVFSVNVLLLSFTNAAGETFVKLEKDDKVAS